MRAKRNAYVTRDLIALTRVDEDLCRGSLALTELRKDRGKGRERKENEKKRKEKRKETESWKREKEERDRRRFSPWARHDPFQRHVGPNQRAKEGGRHFSLKYMEPRATLGLSSLHPGGRLGLSLLCIYIYIIWYKNIALFSSSFIANALSLSCPSFSRLFSLLFSRGRGKKVAGGHVTTTIMPAPSYSPSRPPPPLPRPPPPPTLRLRTRRMHFATVYVRASFLVSFVIFDNENYAFVATISVSEIVDAYEFDNTTRIFLFFFLILHESEKYRGGCIRNFRYAIRMNYRRRVVWLIGEDRDGTWIERNCAKRGKKLNMV